LQLADYVRILRRRALMIILAMIFGVAGAAVATQLQPKVYRTTAQLLVAAPGAGDETSQRLLAVDRAVALGQIGSTPPAVQAAQREAGVAGGISKVDVGADGVSPFINIAVEGSDPVAIAAVANAFAPTLPDVLQDLNGTQGPQPTLSIVSEAGVPALPNSPRPKRNLAIGFVLGTIIGLSGAFGREALDRRLRDSADIENKTGMPVLGVIPIELPKEPLPAATHPQSLRAEAYRLVRTNLQFTDVDGMPPSVLITSASPGDGKTSLATNVAVSCALAGERVIIVDADLRKPTVHQKLGITNDRGLSNILVGRATLEESVLTAFDGTVWVLTSGPVPRNPSELLGSERMASLLQELVHGYDRVIVDGPPVLPVADAVKLSTFVSGVILVARMGDTTRDALSRTQSLLERATSRILGVVANGASPGLDRAYGYGKYEKYGYVQPEGGKRRRDKAAAAPEEAPDRPVPARGIPSTWAGPITPVDDGPALEPPALPPAPAAVKAPRPRKKAAPRKVAAAPGEETAVALPDPLTEGVAPESPPTSVSDSPAAPPSLSPPKRRVRPVPEPQQTPVAAEAPVVQAGPAVEPEVQVPATPEAVPAEVLSETATPEAAEEQLPQEVQASATEPRGSAAPTPPEARATETAQPWAPRPTPVLAEPEVEQAVTPPNGAAPPDAPPEQLTEPAAGASDGGLRRWVRPRRP
jgi:non-specific protein-tyrosine kinase